MLKRQMKPVLTPEELHPLDRLETILTGFNRRTSRILKKKMTLQMFSNEGVRQGKAELTRTCALISTVIHCASSWVSRMCRQAQAKGTKKLCAAAAAVNHGWSPIRGVFRQPTARAQPTGCHQRPSRYWMTTAAPELQLPLHNAGHPQRNGGTFAD